MPVLDALEEALMTKLPLPADRSMAALKCEIERVLDHHVERFQAHSIAMRQQLAENSARMTKIEGVIQETRNEIRAFLDDLEALRR